MQQRGDYMNTEIAVINTNRVQSEITELIKKRTISCRSIDDFNEKSIKEVLEDSKKIVLPFPSTRSNIPFLKSIDGIKDYFSREQTIIGGMLSGEIKSALDEEKIRYYDYFENEAYVLKNALLTSQGAVRLLLENTNEYLVGKKVLITGYGRIGKSLARLLKSLGMKVFVAVRREESAVEALSSGIDSFSFKAVKGTLFYYDYIFNTVPFNIFDEKDVSHMKDSTTYFELASVPFGADKNDFTQHGSCRRNRTSV